MCQIELIFQFIAVLRCHRVVHNCNCICRCKIVRNAANNNRTQHQPARTSSSSMNQQFEI